MRAISLTQPWATLVAIGEKRWETRGWRTKHRGLIAIHAAKGFPKSAAKFAGYIKEGLLPDASLALPLGCIIAVAEIGEIISTDDLSSFWNGSEFDLTKATHERAFGDYSPKRYAWQLNNVRKLTNPVPCKGALSLWQVPTDVERQVLEQL